MLHNIISLAFWRLCLRNTRTGTCTPACKHRKKTISHLRLVILNKCPQLGIWSARRVFFSIQPWFPKFGNGDKWHGSEISREIKFSKKSGDYLISAKRTIQPKIPEGKSNLGQNSGKEIFENLDTPREIVLVFLNSRKCSSTRQFRFPEIQTGIFHPMESDIGFSLVRAFLIVFLITTWWVLLAYKKVVIRIHSTDRAIHTYHACTHTDASVSVCGISLVLLTSDQNGVRQEKV